MNDATTAGPARATRATKETPQAGGAGGADIGGGTTGGELNTDLDAIIPGAEPQERLPDPRTPEVRRAVMKGLVSYVKTNNLAGKGRDDAAVQFLAGATCAAAQVGIDIEPPAEPATYLACLEACVD